MRARLNLDKESSIINNNRARPFTSVTVRKNFDWESTNETRKQIQETMRGTKNILKGITGRTPVSDYYENFR